MVNEYIKMRNSGKYNINWFYEYYISKGGKSIDISKFSMVFNTGNLDGILSDLDREFNLVSLYDNSGTKLIKVWVYE